MAKLMTQAEYARSRGLSRAAVCIAIREKRISTVEGLNGRKMLDPDIADREWDENTDPDQSERARGSRQ
jgi:hypothetical protein